MSKTRTAAGIFIAVSVVTVVVVAALKWTGEDGETETAKYGSPPNFNSYPYLKEGAPPAEEIIAALASENQESIISAHILLKHMVPEEELKWPPDLRKEEVYKHLERHLKSDDLEVVRSAITAVAPHDSFGKGFYRNEERVQLVQKAIKRWNATQSEEDDFFRFYELELNEEGEPVRLIPSAGASVG
jgi:hypothetical protein